MEIFFRQNVMLYYKINSIKTMVYLILSIDSLKIIHYDKNINQ